MVKCKRPPFRLCIAAMIFYSSAMQYCFRLFLSVNIIPMVKGHGYENRSGYQTYSWTKEAEGHLLGAFFYGYTIISPFSGPICEYFGTYWTILVSFLICGIVTLISVFLVMDAWWPLFVCRLIVGLAGGLHYPAFQGLIGAWAPPDEKGKFVASLMGCLIGSIITQISVGYLVEYKWQYGFYFACIATVIYLIPWTLFATDHPSSNKFCPKEEADYIVSTHKGAISAGRSTKPPLLKMAKSIPFIAVVICEFGNLWGLHLLATGIPKFLSEVIGYRTSTVGWVTSFPSVGRFFSSFIYASTADFLIGHEIVKKVYVRKGFVICSHLLPGVIMLSFFLLKDGVHDAIPITMLVLTWTINGAASVTSLTNPQDLAPNYAGTQYGIMCFFGFMPGFIIPSMVAAITSKKPDIFHWSIVFGITGLVYVVTGVTFMIFGSTELQAWNEKRQDAPASDPTPQTTN